MSSDILIVQNVILIGTGSEVHLAVAAQEMLAAQSVSARVVSMPCWELFDEQPGEYRGSCASFKLACPGGSGGRGYIGVVPLRRAGWHNRRDWTVSCFCSLPNLVPATGDHSGSGCPGRPPHTWACLDNANHRSSVAEPFQDRQGSLKENPINLQQFNGGCYDGYDD